MFGNKVLASHLAKSSSLSVSSNIFVEWNMNIPSNFLSIGNYRHRISDQSSIYNTLQSTFDKYDAGNYYTGATDADVVIDGGMDDFDAPLTFTSLAEQTKLLFSLEECLGRFRPRSGINKAKFFPDRFFNYSNSNMALRPRYYMANRDDLFKYWTSDRSESGTVRGVSYPLPSGSYAIDDAAPFVVYEKAVPANRIVVKMQTHIGTANNGPFYAENGASFADPFYGEDKARVPSKWRIQYLLDSTWVDAIAFNATDRRLDGSAIIGPDGYVELYYGIIIPVRYQSIFNYKRTFITQQMLPSNPDIGSAYLIKESKNDPGKFFIYTSSGYSSFTAQYGWSLSESSVLDYRNTLDSLSDPEYFINPLTGLKQYAKFQEIRGIRVVAEHMRNNNSSLDLIEMSPRLVADITGVVENASITKSASDLGNAGMPVGQLLAAVGSISIFDYNLSFSENNANSVIAPYLDQMMKFLIYEKISDTDGNTYMVPIKTMYSAGQPSVSAGNRDVKVELRDLMFFFERMPAPEILMTDVSLSVAISTILDNVGFSNYKFLRTQDDQDLIIPYFFVAPDQSLLQVLQDLAVSSQSAMFLDEENNLVVMGKNYLMPKESDRATDIILSGEKTDTLHANIEDMSMQDSKVFNDGVINYQERYIQRSYGSIKQAMLLDRDKTWIYKPALLWEASGTQNTKAVNGELSNSSNYNLTAIPLNSDLTSELPKVSNGQIVNNIIDFGEGSYFMSRYNGYFYANGEIIKFDAVEYSIPDTAGNVWVQSAQEYSDYFQNVKFGKTMFPTGRVRIYSEPYYEVVNGITQFKSGAVAKHGRGQFGTPVVTHPSGLATSWSDNATNPTQGVKMSLSDLLDSDATKAKENSKAALLGSAGVANDVVVGASRNGIIKNNMGSNQKTESQINALKVTEVGTVQSSALVFNGPSFPTELKPTDYLSYIPKTLSTAFSHFGTRMRIVGRKEDGKVKNQTPTGSMGFYANGTVGGASGGLSVLLNRANNNGYYFEIMALTNDTVVDEEDIVMNNVIFYKIKTDSTGKAVPIKLWSGVTNILVDGGTFVGQARVNAEQNPSVYDLAVEYEEVDKRSARRFYLYINNRCIAIVDDTDPLPIYNSMALFLRGTSRVMFENIYALKKKYSIDSTASLSTPINSVFGDADISVSESLRKYSVSGAIQQTYLSDIGTQQGSGYDMYFDEFGTIMREAAYFKIKYDKAYPALSAQISPTFNRLKGYTVSGFVPGAYGAEFLVFNNTDTVISLDETTGNYLRIQGVTFTQNSDRKATVSEFFKKNSDLSNVDNLNKNPIGSPLRAKKMAFDLEASKATYGTSSFSIDAKYIQNEDAANNLMSWLISKTLKPRKSIGLNMFGGSVMQLGDIAQILWTDDNGIDQVVGRDKRFVVYHIEYNVSPSGPSTSLYLSEVI